MSIGDVTTLEDIEKNLYRATIKLADLYGEETDLEILLLQEVKRHPDITASVPKHQYIQLRRITKDREVERLVDDYLRKQTEVKKAKLTLKQIIGQRDSEKKKLSI